jgi:multiple sugar transport system permease protein
VIYLRKKPRLFKVGLVVSIVLVLLWILVPFYWLTAISFMSLDELAAFPPHFIPSGTWTNYGQVIFGGQLGAARQVGVGYRITRSILPTILNSLVVALSVAGISVLLACPAAYSFSRYRFFGKNTIFLSLLAVRIIPLMVVVIPFFMIFRVLQLTNTYQGLIVAHSTLTIPFSVWIFRDFIDTLPRDLEEAALTDGAGRLGTLVRIVMPLSLPGIVAVAAFAFFTSWGEFLFATTLTNQLTLPPVLLAYLTAQTMEYTQLAAATVIALIPSVLLAFVFQKYLVSGLAGSLKA